MPGRRVVTLWRSRAGTIVPLLVVIAAVLSPLHEVKGEQMQGYGVPIPHAALVHSIVNAASAARWTCHSMFAAFATQRLCTQLVYRES